MRKEIDTMSKEVERVREEALLSLEEIEAIFTEQKLSTEILIRLNNIKRELLELLIAIAQAQLDKILSLKAGNRTLKKLIELDGQGKLLEKAENQELPKNPYGLKQGYDASGSFAMVDSPERWGYDRAQQDMLTPRDGKVWAKVKEEHES